MALYRFSAQMQGRQARGKNGKVIPDSRRSIVAKAAYRSGEALTDKQTGDVHRYGSRSQEVVSCGIVAPDETPAWAQDREALWNQVEVTEKRKDSQLAREFIIALPKELDSQQQEALLREWCRDEVASKGFIADYAIHRSKDGNNPHAHVLTTVRTCDEEGFARTKASTAGKWKGRGVAGDDTVDELVAWRKSWADHANEALEAAGSDERIDWRSLTDRDIDREPEPKVGPEATAMEKRGIETERGNQRREVAMKNYIRPVVRQVQQQGEVAQEGSGATWWEKADVSLSGGVRELREFWWTPASDWRGVVEAQRQPEPEERGPDYG